MRKKMRKAWIVLLTLCSFENHLAAIDPPKQEVRAVWLATNYGLDWPSRPARTDAARIAQQQEARQILDSLQMANFNLVFFQVRLRGDVAYRSAIEPMSRIFTGKCGGYPGYDPLAFIIEECHKRGIECHAWFVTFPLGEEWSVKAQGKLSPVKQHPKLCKKHNGAWFLDPGMPQTADYLQALVREIVQGYDIDGIHFDYIRYPEEAKKFPDKSTYRKYGQGKPLNDWRRDNINRLVAQLYDEVKRLKPWVQVSSSPLGKYSRIPRVPHAGWTAYESVHQDPVEWIRQGKQDLLVPMMYYLHDNYFPFVDHWVEHAAGRWVIPGLGAYRLSKKEGDWQQTDLTDQLDYARYHGASGCAFFRCASILSNEKGIYDELKENYFRYPAQLPPLTWLNDTVPASPSEVRVEKRTTELKLTWTRPQGEKQSLTYTVYYSGTDTIDYTCAKHILATNIHGTELYLPIDTTREQGYLFSVSASSRYHVESLPSQETYYYQSRYEK